MNPQRVAGLVLQPIRGPDDGFFAKDLGDGVGQGVEDEAVASRLLHRNLLEPEIGTISDKTRLNSSAFEIHNLIDQKLEMFTLLCRNTYDTSCLDTDHTTFCAIGCGREVVENGVDLVTLAHPKVREIGEQDGPRSRLLRRQRRKTFGLNSYLSLAFEIGGFRSLQSGRRLGRDMGTDELRNSINENLLGCCTEGEWVIVPKDNV